jgi:protein-disulfide isomerase
MSKRTIAIGIAVCAVVGAALCWHLRKRSREWLAVIPAAALPDSSIERYKIPVGGEPTRGGDEAKVTIVEYADFQSPFCSRIEPTLAQVLSAYGDDVRLIWKNNPIAFIPGGTITGLPNQVVR